VSGVSDPPIRVLVVDDHEVVRLGLQAFLDATPGVQPVGAAADGHDALAQLEALAARDALPDVVLMDLVMRGMDGVAATALVKKSWPQVDVVVVTSFGEAHRVHGALEAGAIANPSEKRMVGHYWLRNPALAPTAEIRTEIEETIKRIKTFAAEVHAGKIKRIVIDALGDLERRSIDRQRFADFIYALTQWFAVENVTCMMTIEVRELFEVHHISDQEISNMSDNLVLMGFTPGTEMKRTIRIIKTRGSSHDNRQHEVEIDAKGVVVKKSK